MVYGSASIYYVRYSVLWRCLKHTFLTFNIWLWFLTFLLLLAFFLNQFIVLLFRLLDEVFMFRYRKVEIKEPVFIIANPRSGTTYLHRLLSLDGERFVYMKFAHTLFPAASFVKFVDVVKWIDQRTGNLIKKTLTKVDSKLYAGWEDIHAMGFNKAEEDEANFAHSMMSPGIFVLFPFFDKIKDVHYLDEQPEHVRRDMMDFYESSTKRFVYAAGSHKTYLVKNVMSTARFKSLLTKFPDAKVIYIARNPYEAVPSMVSMFSAMYEFHSPHIPFHDPAYKEWAEYSMSFYKYFYEMKKSIPEAQFVSIKYDDLINAPKTAVEKVYNHFGWEVSDKFAETLAAQEVRNRNYKSAHAYSLEKYDLHKDYVKTELKEIIEEFGFEG